MGCNEKSNCATFHPQKYYEGNRVNDTEPWSKCETPSDILFVTNAHVVLIPIDFGLIRTGPGRFGVRPTNYYEHEKHFSCELH